MKELRSGVAEEPAGAGPRAARRDGPARWRRALG